MTTLTKPTARAASTALAFEHASDLAASADNAIKRMCDIFAALFGIILLTPLWIIVAAMVRLNDGGPAFFTQERVGLNGKTFTMFKFRTMRVDAEELKASLMEANEADSSAGNSIMFKMANDPRITRISAQDVDRRAAPAVQRPAWRHVPRGPSSPAPQRGCTVRTPRDGQVRRPPRHHRPLADLRPLEPLLG